MTKRFDDKICIVTGGANGIGRATCHLLAAEGGKVNIVDTDETGGGKTLSEIDSGDNAVFMKADIAISENVRSAISRTIEKWGRIDVLVNNAAAMKNNSVAEISEEDWTRILDVNLKAVFLFCKYSLPFMDKAAIVNVSSVHAHRTTANVAPYAVSKAGIEAFTKVLSLEHPPSKVRVNCVAPGATDTEMLWSNPNLKNGSETPPALVASPADIARAICFLASDDAKSINGTTLIVDNGQLAKL